MPPEVFYKKSCSQKFPNTHKKAPVLKSLLNKVADHKPLLERDKCFPTQMFSCEYREISKKIYFEEHLRTAASEVTLGSDCLGLFSGESLSKPFL